MEKTIVQGKNVADMMTLKRLMYPPAQPQAEITVPSLYMCLYTALASWWVFASANATTPKKKKKRNHLKAKPCSDWTLPSLDRIHWNLIFIYKYWLPPQYVTYLVFFRETGWCKCYFSISQTAWTWPCLWTYPTLSPAQPLSSPAIMSSSVERTRPRSLTHAALDSPLL